MPTPIFPSSTRPSVPFSPAIKYGNFLYVSGQTASLPNGKQLQGSITEKTVQIFKNLEKILKAGGSGLDKIVKVNIFLTDMADFKELNAVYATYFPNVKPARSCVAVKELPFGTNVEIECVAVVRESKL